MEELTSLELGALAFNTGIVYALVQVLKLYVVPSLRTKTPWAIPLIALVVGSVSSMVLAASGFDISPIAGAFTGLASSGTFAVIKEGFGKG